MPRYGYGSGGPAEYAMFQQGRRDDQIRNILNMMLSIKQAQEERGWKEREWDQGLEDTEWRRGQEERRTRASERSSDSLVNQRAEEDPKIKQARVIMAEDPKRYPNLGAALKDVLGIKTVDDEIRIDQAKARSGGGGADKPTEWQDPARNAQKQLADMGNFLESEITGLRSARKEYAKNSWSDEGKASLADIDQQIAEKTRRMNMARALAYRLKPGVAIDPKLGAEIGAFLGGEQAQAGPPPAMFPGLPQSPLTNWMMPQSQGQPAPPAMTPPAPAGPPAAVPPTTPQIEPGTRRKNKKTGEVQIWTGTEWQTTKKK